MPKKTTDIRLANDAESDILRLSPLDLANLIASQAKADAADKQVQIAHLRRQVTTLQKEVDTLKLAERGRLLHQATTQQIEHANATLLTCKDQHNAMTQELAKKYRVDWASCGYDELTGVITKV